MHQNATAKLAVRLYITGLHLIRSIIVCFWKTCFTITTRLSIMQYAILETDKMIENSFRESLFEKSFLVCSITAKSFVFESKTMLVLIF